MSEASYFSPNVTDIHTLRALAHTTNSAYSREDRVRSFLAANCARCHQPGGRGPAAWDARITPPLSEAGIVNGLGYNPLGDPFNRVIAPGDLERGIFRQAAGL